MARHLVDYPMMDRWGLWGVAYDQETGERRSLYDITRERERAKEESKKANHACREQQESGKGSALVPLFSCGQSHVTLEMFE